MDPKMVPEFDPQNGVQKWHPKGRPNILNKALISCKSFFNQKKYWATLLGAIFGPHFGGQIGPIFQPLKWFCCQSCIAKLFPASKHAYQNASVVIPS